MRAYAAVGSGVWALAAEVARSTSRDPGDIMVTCSSAPPTPSATRRRARALHAPCVEHAGVSAQEVAPTSAQFAELIARTSERHPWLMLEDGADIAGYAASSPHRARAASPTSGPPLPDLRRRPAPRPPAAPVSPDEPVTVGLDVGTGSARAFVVTAGGSVAGRGSRPLASRRQGARHEQEPGSWWEAVAGACRDALHDVAPQRVRAIATCATSGTVLLVDRDGTPHSPALMYDDARAGDEARRLDMPRSWGLPKLLWLLEHAPDGATGLRLAHQPDLVTRRLVGEAVSSDASHALKSGYDVGARSWPSAVTALLGEALPTVVDPGATLGVVGAAAAAQTGLPAGVPVVAGMTDGCAAQIAAGSLRPGDWNAVLGTTLVLKGSSERRIDDPARGVYSHRAPDGGWLPGGASSSGAGVLPATFPGRDLDELGRRAAAYERTRLLAYPLVSAGERFPFVADDAEAFMLGAPADDGEHVAALLQGLALIERLCFAQLARLGAPLHGELSLTGGATRNRHWCQLRADALAHPVRLPAQSESAFGMAILAAAAAGGERVADVARRMSRTEAVLEPRPAMRAHLDEQYARLQAELRRRGWLP